MFPVGKSCLLLELSCETFKTKIVKYSLGNDVSFNLIYGFFQKCILSGCKNAILGQAKLSGTVLVL